MKSKKWALRFCGAILVSASGLLAQNTPKPPITIKAVSIPKPPVTVQADITRAVKPPVTVQESPHIAISDPVQADAGMASYVLGPEDMIAIRVVNDDELGLNPFRIDLRGFVNVPRLGRVRASGITVEQFEAELVNRFKEYLQEPVVSVTVMEFRSQRVSVFGAVVTPGVHQIQGRKTLYEIISEAGGLKPDAGNTMKITRRNEWGPIPLPTVVTDASQGFSVAQVSLKSVMEARNPLENIIVQPDDVITVPKAELVYVVGAVKRAGGFVLSERDSVSVLQALSMAEGLDHTAAGGRAKILRPQKGSVARTEIALDVKKILAGKSDDVPLLANDILFIPNSAAKTTSLRVMEAALQAATGVATYRTF